MLAEKRRASEHSKIRKASNLGARAVVDGMEFAEVWATSVGAFQQEKQNLF